MTEAAGKFFQVWKALVLINCHPPQLPSKLAPAYLSTVLSPHIHSHTGCWRVLSGRTAERGYVSTGGVLAVYANPGLEVSHISSSRASLTIPCGVVLHQVLLHFTQPLGHG